ncbi:hypothetical protein GGQ22_18445 [Nocardioides sp. zg-579]|uniref:Uncharacterized protein n=1 Tax=Nocardioides marmotae TaxID=2663857 RepID=A0A6I3JFN6_9ACTN|nr:hypothetical protein [Nocardioides marmotae]MCR6033396.1 hypothetical protein [Gordonia jinghuaiqii]MTB97054.1 hypothetical protein [Nocardioides marmotae]QKE00715.1 hypothetical protein HPC71_06210 [Nocardioides marmotae]
MATLALAGCSDDADPGSGPTEAASASVDGSATPSDPSDPSSGTSEPTSDPTASAGEDAGVTPASGLTLTSDAATMRAPKGWTSLDEGALSVSARAPRSLTIVTLSSIPAADIATLDTLENAAKVTSFKAEQVRIQPRREVQGVELYHLVGPELVGGRLDQFGTIYGDQQVTIAFVTPDDTPPARRKNLIESVLASIEWA